MSGSGVEDASRCAECGGLVTWFVALSPDTLTNQPCGCCVPRSE